MIPGTFDPEDFLDLQPEALAAPRAALPPIVTPPTYQRRRSNAVASAAPLRDPFRDAAPRPVAPAAAAAPLAPVSPVPAAGLPLATPPVYPRRGEGAARPAMAAAPVFQTARAALPVHVPVHAVPLAEAPVSAARAYEAEDYAAAEPVQEYATMGGRAGYRAAPAMAAPLPESRRAAAARPAARGPALTEGRAWLRVICEGIELNLRAWNSRGFTLETPLTLDEETLSTLVFDVTLLIGHGATRLEMQARARADLASQSPGERFVFVDQDPEQAAILHRAAGLGLARRPVSVMQLLGPSRPPHEAAEPAPLMAPLPREPQSWAEVEAELAPTDARADAPIAVVAPIAAAIIPPLAAPGNATETKAPKAEPADIRTPPGGRTYRPSLRALALFGALGVAGGFAWNNASAVSARYGAVTVSATSLTAPAAGRLDWLPLQPGQAVETGEILGHLRTEPDLSPLIAQLLAEANDPAAPRIAPPVTGDPRGTPVLSPCDCRVHDIARPTGAQAAAGETLATFAGREAPVIHVLVRADEAAGLAMGNVALIDLADGSSLQGRVARLPAALQGAEVLGLADTVFGAENYARIEIRPDTLLTAAAGTGAEVTLHTSALWGWLRARTHALRTELLALAGF